MTFDFIESDAMTKCEAVTKRFATLLESAAANFADAQGRSTVTAADVGDAEELLFDQLPRN